MMFDVSIVMYQLFLANCKNDPSNPGRARVADDSIGHHITHSIPNWGWGWEWLPTSYEIPYLI